jgi:hypothetical protein
VSKVDSLPLYFWHLLIVEKDLSGSLEVEDGLIGRVVLWRGWREQLDLFPLDQGHIVMYVCLARRRRQGCKRR